MDIYCNNAKCLHFEKLDKVHVLKRGRITPIGHDYDMKGRCKTRPLVFNVCFGCACKSGVFNCIDRDCLFNNGADLCSRDEIGIDKDNKCMSHSLKRISGHMDWIGRFVNPDGTAKGCHIDDDYAVKVDHDNKVNKSFPDHTRQKS